MKRKVSKRLLLLFIIYLAFISLGVPDGILGIAWPSIRFNFELPLELMGVLTTLLLINSAFSSIISVKVLKKWGTGRVTFISCLMTGMALIGYAVAPSFAWLIVFTIPLGLGQGAVDSGLNNFVADNYTSRHMNWLHCFWGAGATIGPIIMTLAITRRNSWRIGYGSVATIQLILALILCMSLVKGMWKVEHHSIENIEEKIMNYASGLYSKTAQLLAVTQFFLYTGIEFSMSLWVCSVLIESREMPMQLAGYVVAAYYAAIMIGRFVSGIIVDKFRNMNVIRGGLILAMLGGVVVSLSQNYGVIFIGIIIFGMGLAPLYPCLMHETPIRFKKVVSSKLIGYQVGASCFGGAIIPSGIGIIMSRFSFEWLFAILIILLCVFFLINEILNLRFVELSK